MGSEAAGERNKQMLLAEENLILGRGGHSQGGYLVSEEYFLTNEPLTSQDLFPAQSLDVPQTQPLWDLPWKLFCEPTHSSLLRVWCTTAPESPRTAALWQASANRDSFPFQKASDLADMITRVIREGLEGLVLKDTKAGSHFLVTGVCWEWSCVDEAHEAGPRWNIPGSRGC